MKRFIDIHIPIMHCNLQCHYCYVSQEGWRDKVAAPFQYTAEHIGESLTMERLGGICHFNICGLGETLIPGETVEIVYELLSNGHNVMIVTNGTLTKRFAEFAEFPLDFRKRLGFKFSFHYLEFKRRNLLQTFFSNIELVKKSDMSFSVEMTPSDELEPYIEDVKEACLQNLGALCHVTIPRDMTRKDIVLLSKRTFSEFCEIWGMFDSAIFDFKRGLWEEERKEFCYAGMWSGLLNIGNGELNACYGAGMRQNIMEDILKPIDFVAVGRHCALPHCYNSHSLLGLGVIPGIDLCTYAEQRDRIDYRDASHWLNEEMREFLSHKLKDSNEELTPAERRKNEFMRVRLLMRYKAKSIKLRLAKGVGTYGL